MMNRQFNDGDRVAISATFLRNICDFSHASASKRGTIAAVGLEVRKGVNLIHIDWDNGEHGRVLSTNLVHADKLHLEPR